MSARAASLVAAAVVAMLPAGAHGATNKFRLERTLQGTHYQSEWVERSSGRLDIEEDAADGTRFRTVHVTFAPDGRASQIEGAMYSPFAAGSPPLVEYSAVRADRHVHATIDVHRSLLHLGADSTGTWDYDLAEHDVFLPFGTAGLDEYLQHHPVASAAAADIKWVDGLMGPIPLSLARETSGHVTVELEDAEHHEYALDRAGRITSGTVALSMHGVHPTLKVARKAWVAPGARDYGHARR